jgi:serine/threonine-protein kinase
MNKLGAEGPAASIGNLGKYELVARIGKGGMAEVYLARQKGPMNFQKVVVVKTIHPELASQEQFLNMLFDEARVSALIKHPRVVDIYDLGHEEGTYFIAMEYLDGQALSSIMTVGKKGDPLDVYSTARIIADAAEGLHAAHELKSISGKRLDLVHRDVSPGNIIVLYDGNVKIVDFGIAKARGRLTQSGLRQLKGKLGYMSPEQAAGEPVDRRSDVYGLGVVLWEALTLERLFAGDEDGEQPRVPREPPPPSSIRTQVVRELDEVCLQALSPKPADRFQTARDMKQAIEFVLRSVNYSRESGSITRYMGRVFAERRMERQKLLRARSTTLPGLETIPDEMSGPEMVVEVTVETGGGEETLPAKASATARPAGRPAPRPDPPPAPRSHAWQIFVIVLCLAVGAGVGAFVFLRDGEPPPDTPTMTVASRPAAKPPAPAAPRRLKSPPPERAPTPAPPDEVEPDRDDEVEPDRDEPRAKRPRKAAAEPDKPDKTDTPKVTQSAAELHKEAMSLFVQGKAEQAKEKFKEAIAADPGHAPSYRGLGLAYEKVGKKEKAIRALERYLALEPQAADADSIRARIDKLKP